MRTRLLYFSLRDLTSFLSSKTQQSTVLCSLSVDFNQTRGPMGHILDTTMRCFRAIRVQLPNKGKFAKLKPNLEKYLHHLMEHFLTIMIRVQYKGLYSSQSCYLEGTHLIFYALKYTYHIILMALKQTNKTNLAQNGHKLEKLYLNRTKI